jgi:hypothetical protein
MDAGVMTSLAKETGHKIDEMEFLEKMTDYLSKVFEEDIGMEECVNIKN